MQKLLAIKDQLLFFWWLIMYQLQKCIQNNKKHSGGCGERDGCMVSVEGGVMGMVGGLILGVTVGVGEYRSKG